MDEKYCDCHFKHSAILDRLERQQIENDTEHDVMWASINKKVGINWLVVLVPIIMAWIGFQVVIYDSLKNVETKIAVVQEQLKGVGK